MKRLLTEIKKMVFFNRKKQKRFQSSVFQRASDFFRLKGNVINHFHKLYYESEERTWKNTFWLGAQAQKCPLDLWIYQEIIFENRPDVIVECGTYSGGSALFLASICNLLKKGEIITIDIERMEDRPQHDRLTYLLGSSTAQEIVEKIKSLIKDKDRIMVILDSDHNKAHVLKELEIYSHFVTKDSYMIVEDTNVNGHPVNSDFGPGPMEAVREFLEGNKDFVIDRSREKFYLTFNPDGYLKRIR
jgi:cephalosporin hydroxylase